MNNLKKTLRFFFVLFVLVSNISAAEAINEGTLQGNWVGGDHASESIYGIMKISKNKISWGGTNKYNPKCSTEFVIEKEAAGTSFQEIMGKMVTIDADNSQKTYLLSLTPSKCVHVRKIRLTFGIESEPDYLDMIEYSDHPVGYMHFHRR